MDTGVDFMGGRLLLIGLTLTRLHTARSRALAFISSKGISHNMIGPIGQSEDENEINDAGHLLASSPTNERKYDRWQAQGSGETSLTTSAFQVMIP